MPSLASAPHLLVVEDDAELLSLVRESLEEEGYGVTPVASLADSLRALEEHLFHFVLTDLFREPGQRSALQSIHPLIGQATPIPVGVVTAWPISDDDPALADLAFLLRKPFDLDDLLRSVDAQLHPKVSSARQSELVEQFFLALNAHNWNLLTRLCAPDIQVAPPMAASNVRIGLISYLAYLEQRLGFWPDYTIEQAQLFARRDGVAARYLALWHSRDGRSHQAAGSMHFRFRSGRIAQIEGAF